MERSRDLSGLSEIDDLDPVTPDAEERPDGAIADSNYSMGTLVLTEAENEIMAAALAVLRPAQLKAVRLDSMGLDTHTIAVSTGFTVETIRTWKGIPEYKKLKDLMLMIIQRQGLQFRLEAQKQILAPAYLEVMKRMSDPAILSNLAIRDLLEVIRSIGRECRFDTPAGSGDSEEKEDLKDLQSRRTNFSHARQQQQIERLKQDSKIIEYPSGTGTDG